MMDKIFFVLLLLNQILTFIYVIYVFKKKIALDRTEIDKTSDPYNVHLGLEICLRIIESWFVCEMDFMGKSDNYFNNKYYSSFTFLCCTFIS